MDPIESGEGEIRVTDRKETEPSAVRIFAATSAGYSDNNELLPQDENQDAMAWDEGYRSGAVCDGVTGHTDSKGARRVSEASQRAANAMVEGMAKLKKYYKLDECREIVNNLREITHNVSNQMIEASDYGMESATMVAAQVVRIQDDSQTSHDYVAVVHRGDARAYVLRGDELIQITTDESALRKLVGNDQIYTEVQKTFDRAQSYKDLNSEISGLVRRYPQLQRLDLKSLSNGLGKGQTIDLQTAYNNWRGVISNALGSDEEHLTDPDVTLVKLQSGDRVILTSDAIDKNMTPDMITDTVIKSQGDPADALVERALKNSINANEAGILKSTPDNTTAVVIEVDPGEKDAFIQDLNQFMNILTDPGSNIDQDEIYDEIKNYLKNPLLDRRDASNLLDAYKASQGIQTISAGIDPQRTNRLIEDLTYIVEEDYPSFYTRTYSDNERSASPQPKKRFWQVGRK